MAIEALSEKVRSGNGGSNKIIVNTRWSLRGFSLVYHIENLITIIVLRKLLSLQETSKESCYH